CILIQADDCIRYFHLTGVQTCSLPILQAEELPFEFLMNVLRLTDGVPALLFTQRTGLPLERLAEARREAEARGLLVVDPQRLVATPKGQLFLNDLLQLFLP